MLRDPSQYLNILNIDTKRGLAILIYKKLLKIIENNDNTEDSSPDSLFDAAFHENVNITEVQHNIMERLNKILVVSDVDVILLPPMFLRTNERLMCCFDSELKIYLVGDEVSTAIIPCLPMLSLKTSSDKTLQAILKLYNYAHENYVNTATISSIII